MELDNPVSSTHCGICRDEVSNTQNYPEGMKIRVCDDPLCYHLALDQEVTKRVTDRNELDVFYAAMEEHNDEPANDPASSENVTTTLPTSTEEVNQKIASLRARGVEIRHTVKHRHGFLGLAIGDVGQMKVDAVMIPTTNRLKLIHSMAIEAIKKRVGNGLEKLCEKLIASRPTGEACPTGKALLSKFTGDNRLNEESPPMETPCCIHVSVPNFSTATQENMAQELCKNVEMQQAIKDGFRLAHKAKMRSVGITSLLPDELRGEKDIAEIALLVLTSIRDFSFPGMEEIIVHCSNEEELKTFESVGTQVFGSLEHPIKSRQEQAADEANSLQAPVELQYSQQCAEFKSYLTNCRNNVFEQLRPHERIPQHWLSISSILENITSLFETIARVVQEVQDDQLKATNDVLTLTTVQETLVSAETYVLEAIPLHAGANPNDLENVQVTKQVLTLTRKVQAVAETLYKRITSLLELRKLYHLAVQKCRQASLIETEEFGTPRLNGENNGQADLLDASKLYDEPTGDPRVYDSTLIAVSEMRDPLLPEGMARFGKMDAQQQKIILNEMYASKNESLKTAVEVHLCALKMEQVAAKCDSQMASGEELRESLKTELISQIPDYKQMFKDGILTVTSRAYGLRHLRKITQDQFSYYQVNDDKARWAQLDSDLWNELSKETQNILVNAESIYGSTGDPNLGKFAKPWNYVPC